MKPIVITGQTATGKTKTAIEVARRINGEIISADAVQIYRYMDIGSAKPSKKEQSLVKHHLIDILSPDETFSAGEFARLADELIKELLNAGKNPVIVGGTAFYIDALINGIDRIDPIDDNVRLFFDDICDELGSYYLFEWLEVVDKKWADRLSVGDCQRIKRGLSVFVSKGKPLSSFFKNTSRQDEFCVFVLYAPKEALKERIKKRTELMIEEGLIEETKRLIEMGFGDSKALRSIGYAETVDYILGKIKTSDELKDLIVKNTLSFAKRQLTFIKSKFKDAHWIEITKEDPVDVILNSPCCHLP
ncbi:tRNA (adenosine(37)-N6)-dimethylallyltransferase MiaA [Hippea sp. KM1]|uniref:tRNA (adenosine(37)-N6)-dimethylallyltransferase MiaA n=1 Tax=Hippea sp. KM1 TaxID=944481 RepID=UPI00046D377C|nr:tRNA (adenosine(37)-N6)-dimethylallyltransferase MiaA [Hippea sp. KM1]